VPFHCFTRVQWNPYSPRRRWIRASLPFLLTGLCLVLASRPAHAASGTPYSGFKIDLREVSRLYDSLYRDRVTDQLIDSTATMDWEQIKFGNQRYRIKTFLPTDYSATHQVTDYTVIPGYRTVFTVPPVRRTLRVANLPYSITE